MAALKVLLVEDDDSFREVIALHLQSEGWTILAAADGQEAMDLFAREQPDVLLLDVMLPKMTGIEVCAAIRRDYQPGPGIVMLTARDSEADTVLGFDVGADDYVIKPCRPREIIARIRAVARRMDRTESNMAIATKPTSVLERGTVRIDLDKRLATVGTTPLKLTQTEFALLALLAENQDKVYSRKDLLLRIWDTDHDGYARNVDCHVTRLRRKMENAGLTPAPIHTVHGAGYCFSFTRPG